MRAPEPASIGAERLATVSTLVADPVVSNAGAGWQVGQRALPSAPDPAAARAARLEARLAVYAQYAAVVGEEAAAAVAGDEARRSALTSERGAAAEHFAELRDAVEVDNASASAFADALTDALHELRHQDAVDDALGRRLRALRDAAAGREMMPALPAGGPLVRQLDLRF